MIGYIVAAVLGDMIGMGLLLGAHHVLRGLEMAGALAVVVADLLWQLAEALGLIEQPQHSAHHLGRQVPHSAARAALSGALVGAARRAW